MRFTQKSSRRQKGAAISTASLPDIIFMILFFFMVVAIIPPPQSQIETEIPVIEGGVELDETKHYIHVYIGGLDGELVAQIGYDKVVPLSELAGAVKEIREEDPQRYIVVLRVDGDTGMGYIENEIHPQLLEVGIKKINYYLEDEKTV